MAEIVEELLVLKISRITRDREATKDVLDEHLKATLAALVEGSINEISAVPVIVETVEE